MPVLIRNHILKSINTMYMHSKYKKDNNSNKKLTTNNNSNKKVTNTNNASKKVTNTNNADKKSHLY